MKTKFFLIIFISTLLFLAIPGGQATNQSTTFPRLANYFLKWEISKSEAEELAKWNLLILDMETQHTSPDKIRYIRELNPQIIILAYLTSQEIITDLSAHPQAHLRQKLRSNILDTWWLKDSIGRPVVNWPGTAMLNISDSVPTNNRGERFNDYLVRFVIEEIKPSGLWDGIFYDNTWGDVSWVNGGNLDINNHGRTDNSSLTDQLWSAGMEKILTNTRKLAGDDFLIVGNGRIFQPYLPLLHGMMFESFPSPWESGGTWQGSVGTYLDLPKNTRQPSLPIINTYHHDRTNYQLFRFTLTSALLGNGYFSFDCDVTGHHDTWWFDEYEVALGPSNSIPYNLLDPHNFTVKPGLWRRDFKNGLVIVNSTDKEQLFVFSKEEFEKIRGQQDVFINNGQKINWLRIAPQDGIVLLKQMSAITHSSFVNGEFVRIVNSQGEEVRNGFFSYLSQFPGSSEVLVYDLDQDGEVEIINAHQGLVSVYKNGNLLTSFRPFHPAFRGKISLAAGDLNGNGQVEIVTGAGPGGGPQVRVFNLQGILVSTFFAYQENFRGGLDLAVGDINGNGKAEIVTGAGPGGGPHLRVFDYQGRELSNFFAYDHGWRGGVSIAVGDISGNGKAEIITGPGPKNGATIKYFDEKGRLLGSFLAADNYQAGLNVAAFDALGDGQAEIIIGLKDF